MSLAWWLQGGVWTGGRLDGGRLSGKRRQGCYAGCSKAWGSMCWRSRSRLRLNDTSYAAAWVLQQHVGIKKQQQADASKIYIPYMLCTGAACGRTAGRRRWPCRRSMPALRQAPNRVLENHDLGQLLGWVAIGSMHACCRSMQRGGKPMQGGAAVACRQGRSACLQGADSA